MENQTNTDVLSAYREQKQKMEQLAEAARVQMLARYAALLTEAAIIQKEFKVSFNTSPVLPPFVKAFTLVPAEGRTKPPQSEAAAKGKKIGGLKRSLTAARKNKDKAKEEEVLGQLALLGVVEVAEPVDEFPL